MVSFDADPLDGPEISTSDPGGSLKSMVMYLLGAGVFFALLSASQATVTPAVQSVLDMIPAVSSGSETSVLGTNGGGL